MHFPHLSSWQNKKISKKLVLTIFTSNSSKKYCWFFNRQSVTKIPLYKAPQLELADICNNTDLCTVVSKITMHYGFSYHFQGYGTIFVFKLILWLQFPGKWLKHFLHDRQLPKDYAKYFFDQIRPIFAEIFAKDIKGSPAKSEILCVNQIDRDLKKSRKQQF